MHIHISRQNAIAVSVLMHTEVFFHHRRPTPIQKTLWLQIMWMVYK